MSVAVLLGGCGRAEDRKATAAQAAPAPAFSHPRTIDNRYLPLTVKRRCLMRGRGEDGTNERSVRTVLNTTRRFNIAGQPVDAAVIRDNAYEGGKLVESTLDYFAQADDGTVYYLGEAVRNIRRGKLVNRSGSWLYGRDTNVPGVAMPGNPKLGDQWRFEDAPGITVESNRVEETGLRAKANGKLYTDVIRVSEFIQPEGEIEFKLYAPGVGLVTEYDPEGRAEFAGCR
ncbi:MAG: hypothetical protein M3550_16405 [Actinomycetota bacterium]|nr:hypothetical protein [Actinomycetota bacterium]